MKIEIITIGTELFSEKVNTNGVFIGSRLARMGLEVARMTTVGDDRADMEQVFNEALDRSDIVITTGGLGPTFDDITRSVAAKVVGTTLVQNDDVLRAIESYAASRQRKMLACSKAQALVLEGARILITAVGTAPGQIVEHMRDGKEKILILLPGPPREVHAIFPDVEKVCLQKYKHAILKKCTLHICGLSESEVDERIRPVVEAERKLENGTVSFSVLAHQMIVDVSISVTSGDEMLVDETLGHLKKELHDILGDHVYGEDEETLASAVGQLLGKAQKTVALAESCTGGMLGARLTATSGSSLYFKFGTVTYANDMKIQMLGVNAETIRDFGAVSEQVALEMAEGVRHRAGADYSLSITGVAGPTGGTSDKPVGLVYVGVCGPAMKEVYRFRFLGTRADVRERATSCALDALRRVLLHDASPQRER